MSLLWISNLSYPTCISSTWEGDRNLVFVKLNTPETGNPTSFPGSFISPTPSGLGDERPWEQGRLQETMQIIQYTFKVFICVIMGLKYLIIKLFHNRCHFKNFFILILQSDFPKDSDMVESFECQQTQTNRYVTNKKRVTTFNRSNLNSGQHSFFFSTMSPDDQT